MIKTTTQRVPSSKESEMMVVGCMLTSPHALEISCSQLTTEDFYFTEHKSIFQTIKHLHKNDKPADVHLVCEELKRKIKLKSIGGPGYITTLAQFAGTSANIEEYCNELRKKSLSRQALHIHKEAIEEFIKDPEDPHKVSEKNYQRLVDLGKRYSPTDKASIGEILSGNKSSVEPVPLVDRIKLRQTFYQNNGKPCLQGLPTGFLDLDNKMAILKDTSLIVIAGRPAMGKTAFALNIAGNVCLEQGMPVGFISLEMGRDQLAERLLSMRSKVPGYKIEQGTLSDHEYRCLLVQNDKLKKAPFFIHDQAVSYVSQVTSRARRLKDEEDIRLLVIDYLQLLGTDGRNDSRQYEVAEVSRNLKRLAMDLKIPVICIAQLSRKVEERGDKRPIMSDLRDSGQIEQDADAIVFLYRRSYYEPNESQDQAEVIIAKNRHGPTTNIKLAFIKDSGLFQNLSTESALNQQYKKVKF